MGDQGKMLRPSGPLFALKHRDSIYVHYGSVRYCAKDVRTWWEGITERPWKHSLKDGYRIVKVKIVPYSETTP